MMVPKEEVRKGPWTEQEDLQLVCFVSLFGERHWDFIAKVSGLNRTGKSCRLRWVNYLHPDLKRGRMTAEEERLILKLHEEWGNRWSRIARRLPGRTDNEIKNYWRTYMRKLAQGSRRNLPSLSLTSSSCNISFSPHENLLTAPKAEKHEVMSSLTARTAQEEEEVNVYPMDQIWNEIDILASTSGSTSFQHDGQEDCNVSCAPIVPRTVSPLWECCAESLWKVEENNFSMISTTGTF